MVEVDSIGGDFGALIGTIAKGLQASGLGSGMRLKLLERKFVLIVVEVFNLSFGNTVKWYPAIYFFLPPKLWLNSFSKKHLQHFVRSFFSISWFIGYFFCGESDYLRSISSVEIPQIWGLNHPVSIRGWLGGGCSYRFQRKIYSQEMFIATGTLWTWISLDS